MGIEDIYSSEKVDRGFWGEDYEDLEDEDEEAVRQIEQEDLVKCDRIYKTLAEKCQESIYQWFDEARIKEGDAPRTKEVGDALLEVNWYLDLIHSKIRRALYGYYIYSDKINATQEEDDYNGSAKVALLAVEISQNAWMVLRERLSSFEPNISPVMQDEWTRTNIGSSGSHSPFIRAMCSSPLETCLNGINLKCPYAVGIFTSTPFSTIDSSFKR